MTDTKNCPEILDEKDKYILRLTAALSTAAHKLYDITYSCPNDSYDWEHPLSCSKVCASYKNPDEAWKCWLDWLVFKGERMPETIITPRSLWDNAPSWAKYLVMDSDGCWTWYSKRPTKYQDCYWNFNDKRANAYCPKWEITFESRKQ